MLFYTIIGIPFFGIIIYSVIKIMSPDKDVD